MIRNRFGFTLVEALITLGIIGVIAGLAIPQAVAGRMAQQAKSQFDTAYAILQHAVADMASDGVELQQGQMRGIIQSGTSTTGNYANTAYSKFKPYLKISVDCGATASVNQKTCVSNSTANNTYQSYNGNATNSLNGIITNGAFVLSSGMLVAFSGHTSDLNVFVSIDINGRSKLPNKWGWDVFTFQVMDGELVPVGASGTSYKVNGETPFDGDDRETYCSSDSSGTYNGITCAYFALNDEEYFKKLYGVR